MVQRDALRAAACGLHGGRTVRADRSAIVRSWLNSFTLIFTLTYALIYFHDIPANRGVFTVRSDSAQKCSIWLEKKGSQLAVVTETWPRSRRERQPRRARAGNPRQCRGSSAAASPGCQQ